MTKILEICVDNLESFINALNGGANRIELCSALGEGGLTPSVGFLKQVQALNTKKIPIYCMIRCRRGFDFNYTPEEMSIMIEDAKLLKQNGADGFVFGALTKELQINTKQCREIIKTCYPQPVTFHRAFDVCKNPLVTLEAVIDVGFERILTSGQKLNALDGAENIKTYIEKANGRIIIMAGCGVNVNNVSKILSITGVKEVHGSASSFRDIDNTDNNKNEVYLNDQALNVTEQSKVEQLIKIIQDNEV
ncbi:copper homeostasis protein CutC [Chrysoperla carnea]|uniref:copper homeostasis protein CutC n=1 Tax=Chrysoperla carnea TaxID=189513 RepID=UPI001D08639C|nr:copper homeostasis protein CutC [Chrysoperla carnea]